MSASRGDKAPKTPEKLISYIANTPDSKEKKLSLLKDSLNQEPKHGQEEITSYTMYRELKFVNREEECEIIISKLLDNSMISNISHKILIGFGQTYGAGKTSVAKNLLIAGKHYGFFEKIGARTGKIETAKKLSDAIYLEVDFRSLNLDSCYSFEQKIFERFLVSFSRLEHKDYTVQNELNSLKEKLMSLQNDGKTLDNLCALLNKTYEKNNSLYFLIFIDEIDYINSGNNLKIQTRDLLETDPYERMYTFWSFLTKFLEQKNIFLLVAGKSSSLTILGKKLVSDSKSSPTHYFPVVLPPLDKYFYKESIQNTKVTINCNEKYDYQLSAFDVLEYKCNFNQDLVNEFVEQAYVYSQGIPRILYYITEAYLEYPNRKITTKDDIISILEKECFKKQKMTDLIPNFETYDTWMKEAYWKLLLFAVLKIPIDIDCKFPVDQNREISILELISNLNIWHEYYNEEENISISRLIRLIVPKYSLLLLRADKNINAIQIPSFVLSESLLSNRMILDKGDLLQEISLHCFMAHFIQNEINTSINSPQRRKFSEILDGIFKNCFFKDQYVILNSSADGFFVKNIPGFHQKGKRKIDKNFGNNPWQHVLKPCWTSLWSVLGFKTFNISPGMFLRPAPRSVGGDLYYYLPNDNGCDFIIFQFKYYKEDENGNGDVTWASLQTEINNVSRFIPNGERMVQICLIFVCFGLGTEVNLAIKSNNDKSLLLTSGKWHFEDSKFVKVTDNKHRNFNLQIPKKMEVLFLAPDGMKCILSESNYELLKKYNNNFKLSTFADKSVDLFNTFNYLGSNKRGHEGNVEYEEKKSKKIKIGSSTERTIKPYGMSSGQQIANISYAAQPTLEFSTGQQIASTSQQGSFDLGAWIADKMGLNIKKEDHKRRLEELTEAFDKAGYRKYDAVQQLDDDDLSAIDSKLKNKLEHGEKKLLKK